MRKEIEGAKEIASLTIMIDGNLSVQALSRGPINYGRSVWRRSEASS